jgi:hypothetical protein
MESKLKLGLVTQVQGYNALAELDWKEDYRNAPENNKPFLLMYVFVSDRTGRYIRNGYVASFRNSSILCKTKREAEKKLEELKRRA